MLATAYRFLVNRHYSTALESEGIQDAESLERWARGGEVVSHSSTSEVRRSNLNKLEVYVKRRHYARGSWRYFARVSRGLCEWRNQEELARLGISCPDLICLGEKRSWGRLCWSILVTRAVPGTESLLERFRREGAAKGENLRRRLLGELGLIVRRLHDRHFILRDAKLRNVLVVEDGQRSICLYLIDCPRGRYPRLLIGRAVKRDLARLRRDVLKTCSLEEWQIFLDGYSFLPPAGGEKE